MEDNYRLLILGQTPPPWHGQAVATKMLFDHDWPGIEVETLRMAYSEEMESVGRFQLAKLRHLFALIRDTRRILRKNPQTILFYPPASAFWVPFLRDVVFLFSVRHLAAGTVFIFHAGGLATFVRSSFLRRFLGRLAYGKADLALEVSMEAVAPHEVFGVRHWEWCPCAIEVPELDRPEAGEVCEVLFVASLQEGKGVLEVVRTAALLRERGLAGQFSFKVVGPWFSEEFRRQAEKLVDELGVGDLVRFPGELTGDDKWRAYGSADVFFFPSHYESEASPIVLMEALGIGLPIVTTRWRGIPAMVEECEAVALCPTRDPKSYADALEALWRERERFPEIAERAREYYRDRYRPEHFLGRIERSLERIWWRDLRLKRTREEREQAGESPAPDQLRVLQVFNQYTEQGGEELWVDEMSRLSNRELRIDNLRFLSRAWKSRGAPSRVAQARRIWNNPESRQQLREAVDAEGPELLVFHNLIPVASLGMYEEAGQLRLPVLQFVHNFRPFSPSGTMWVNGEINRSALEGNMWPEVIGGAWEGSRLKTAVLATMLRRLLASGWLDSVTRWVAISDFMRERFLEAGVPGDKVVTLRHCWRSMPEAPAVRRQDYYLFLGRLVTEKGIGTLIDAWEILEQRLGASCPRLVVAGTGPAEREVRGRIARLGKVDFAGFLSGDAKARALRNCKAVLAPSIWWEPLGLIVYEAYDFGKPVIAARSGGLVETVREGEGGLLHEPGNAEDLARAVIDAEARGDSGREKMGSAGRAWLLREADPAAWRQRFCRIAREAMNGE